MPGPAHPPPVPPGEALEDQGETVTAVADLLAAVAGDARLLGEDLAPAQTADLQKAAARCGRLAQELSGCAQQLGPCSGRRAIAVRVGGQVVGMRPSARPGRVFAVPAQASHAGQPGGAER